MNWENIGKLSFAIICGCVVGGILYLIIKIVSWKWHVDSKIELQDEINKEFFKGLKNIEKMNSEERSEDVGKSDTDINR